MGSREIVDYTLPAAAFPPYAFVYLFLTVREGVRSLQMEAKVATVPTDLRRPAYANQWLTLCLTW